MSKSILLAIIICMLIIILWKIYDKYYKKIYIQSSEGKYYSVFKKPDAKIAADKLSMININIAKLVGYLKKKYTYYETNKNIIMMINNYNPDVLHEHRPSSTEKNVAFTIDKGESMYICLRDKQGNLHDDNTLMFVALHELTHMSTEAINHPYKFWITFKWILQNANEVGIIEIIDYAKHPQEYCTETKITYNPLLDEKLI